MMLFQGSVQADNAHDSQLASPRAAEKEEPDRLPTTSTPKKGGEGPSGNEHIDVSPVKLTSQQPETSNDISLNWVDSYVEWLHEENRENTQGDEGSTWQDNYTRCDICGACCRIASHLRRPGECLRQLKLLPQFQFPGGDKDEVFITRIALLIGECPNPSCSSGRHPDQIPPDCVGWWKSDGWKIMRWRGDKERADNDILKEKIRDFVRRHKKKDNRHSQAGARSQVSQCEIGVAGSITAESGLKCSSCEEEGDLMQHLLASSQCRLAYVKHFLTDDEVDSQTSLFQLSISLNMCARLGCTERKGFTYLASHLDRSEECLEFYQSEGVKLGFPNWDPSASSRIISKKISQIRRQMKESRAKMSSSSCEKFKGELSHLLEHVCRKCGKMGPGVGDGEFRLLGGWTWLSDQGAEEGWFCPDCTEESAEYTDTLEKLKEDTERLKKSPSSQTDSFKMVKSTSSTRTIVAPTCLIEGIADVSNAIPSLSTRILVPQDATAIRAIMGHCDEAIEDRVELKRCTSELMNKPFVTDFEATVSCLYRTFLAEVRHKMKIMTMALAKSARGKIISFDQNLTSARKSNPNLKMTLEGALRDLCAWSLPYQKLKSLESAARANINGRVKVYLKGTIIKGLEDENLRRIILLGFRCFANGNITSFEQLENHPGLEAIITNMAPVILRFVRDKVKLFVRHIVKPNFSNYDLRLDIADHGLDVKLVGYLYTKQFDKVNRTLAENPQIQMIPDITDQIIAAEEVKPTTSLNWETVADNYKVGELRAKNIIEIAQHCQVGDVAFPLSLLDIYTPTGWQATEKEKLLRFRVEQLSHERNPEENTVEAIIDIVKELLDEGLFEELIFEEVDRDIRQSMKRRLEVVCPDQDRISLNALHWYHTLLLRTGQSHQWTLRRHCGATLVIPYHPLLLEALMQQVEVRIAVGPEHLHVDHDQVCSEIMAGVAWKDISLLKFLHGVTLDNYNEPVSQFTIKVIASQDKEYNFTDSNERDEECDDIFTNSKGETFIITNGDLRKLYVKRPPSMQSMTFAQFIISYYRKQKRQQAIIDPETGVGEDSVEPIVGGEDVRAPLFMSLSNNIIMKKRSDSSEAVPLLLNQNAIDSYGERMMFQPWGAIQELDEDQSIEDKRKQKENRLNLFPLSIFPKCE